MLAFTRESFEMSLHFVAEQERAVAEMKARYEADDSSGAEDGGQGQP